MPTQANDNRPLSTDTVIEQRPSPEELNRILHRRFPGMGPAHGVQLDEAARKTFNADFSKWLGLDGRWHPCGEYYRQPRGSRRLAKPGTTAASSEPVRDGWLFTDTVACRWQDGSCCPRQAAFRQRGRRSNDRAYRCRPRNMGRDSRRTRQARPAA